VDYPLRVVANQIGSPGKEKRNCTGKRRKYSGLAAEPDGSRKEDD